MGIESKDQTIADFSGGITGDPTKALPSQCKVMDNMVITPHRSAKVRYGSEPIHDSNSFERCRGLFSKDDIYFVRGKDLNIINADKTSTIITPVSATQLYNISDTTVSVNGRPWRDHILLASSDIRRPSAFYTDVDNVDRLTTLGLPYFTVAQKAAFSVTSSVTTGLESYLFVLTWSYSYTVGDVTYKRLAPIHQIRVTDTDNTATFVVANLPTLDNTDYGEDSHFDEANISLELYASTENGTSLFLIDTFSNSSIPSNAFLAVNAYTLVDDILLASASLYTNGGTLERDMPPKCKDITIVNNVAYYMNTIDELDEDTSENKPYRIVQSIPSVIPSVNNSSYKDLDDTIVGGGAARGKLIVLTDTYIYRIEGVIASDGRGSMRPIVISTDIGCLSRDSIVTTKDGVYFAGRDGFYFTDGVNFKELTGNTKALERRYRDLVGTSTEYSRINGTLDAMNNRIIWSVSSHSGVSDNDSWWVYDITFDAFSTASGDIFYSSALLYDKEIIYRGDDYGYVYQHKEDLDSDYTRNSSVAVSLWEKAPIPYELKPVFFTNLNDRLWLRSVSVATESSRDISMAMEAELLNGRTYKMAPITYRANSVWRDINNVWADPTDLWKPSLLQSKRRRFPRGSSRTRGITVGMSAGESLLFQSDVHGLADLSYKDPTNPVELLLYLQDYGGPDVIKFPSDIVGYIVKFSDDNYQISHKITARTDSTLTLSGGSTPIGTDKEWHLYGIPKMQDVEIKALTYKYGVVGNEDNVYQSNEEGANE